jgi:hypothetical protein
MKQFLTAILFLPLLTSITMGADKYGLDDIPGMLEAVEEYKQTLRNILKVRNRTLKDEKQEDDKKQEEDLEKDRRQKMWKVVFCGDQPGARNWDGTPMPEIDMGLIFQRLNAVGKITLEVRNAWTAQ